MALNKPFVKLEVKISGSISIKEWDFFVDYGKTLDIREVVEM